MKYDVIFWDWNGTIIDDVEICMETVNSLLKEYGKKPFSARAEYHKVFRFPSSIITGTPGSISTKCLLTFWRTNTLRGTT